MIYFSLILLPSTLVSSSVLNILSFLQMLIYKAKLNQTNRKKRRRRKNKSKYQQKLKESAAFSLTTLSAQDKLCFQNERCTNSAGSRNQAVLQAFFLTVSVHSKSYPEP